MMGSEQSWLGFQMIMLALMSYSLKELVLSALEIEMMVEQ
jgi:hypothetical protein